MITGPSRSVQTPEQKYASVNNIRSLEQDLIGLAGTNAAIAVNDGTLRLSSGDNGRLTGTADRPRVVPDSWSNCELVDKSQKRVFAIDNHSIFIFSSENGGEAIYFKDKPTHPVYGVVADVLREAIEVAKKRPVPQGEVARYVRERIVGLFNLNQ